MVHAGRDVSHVVVAQVELPQSGQVGQQLLAKLSTGSRLSSSLKDLLLCAGCQLLRNLRQLVSVGEQDPEAPQLTAKLQSRNIQVQVRAGLGSGLGSSHGSGHGSGQR